MLEKSLADIECALVDLKAIARVCLRVLEEMNTEDLPSISHDITTMYYIMLDKITRAEAGTHELYKEHYRRAINPEHPMHQQPPAHMHQNPPQCTVSAHG